MQLERLCCSSSCDSFAIRALRLVNGSPNLGIGSRPWPHLLVREAAHRQEGLRLGAMTCTPDSESIAQPGPQVVAPELVMCRCSTVSAFLGPHANG